jgi:hypothetical protein
MIATTDTNWWQQFNTVLCSYSLKLCAFDEKQQIQILIFSLTWPECWTIVINLLSVVVLSSICVWRFSSKYSTNFRPTNVHLHALIWSYSNTSSLYMSLLTGDDSKDPPYVSAVQEIFCLAINKPSPTIRNSRFFRLNVPILLLTTLYITFGSDTSYSNLRRSSPLLVLYQG